MRRVKTKEPEGYHEAWCIWGPHCRPNDGRGDGRRAYQAALDKGYAASEIAEAAEYFIAHKLADRNFIPMFATWLNREPFYHLLDERDEKDRKKAELVARRDAAKASNVTPIRPHLTPNAKRVREQCDRDGKPYPSWLEAELQQARASS